MLGIDESNASIFMSVITIAITVAVLPAGYIASGKFGRRNTYLVGMAVMVLGAVTLVFFPRLYLPCFIVMGVGMGIGFPSQLPLVTELVPNQEKLGSVIGVYNIFYLAGFVLGTSILGAIIQATSYNALFVTTTIFMSFALLSILFVKMPKKSEQAVISGEKLSEIPAVSSED